MRIVRSAVNAAFAAAATRLADLPASDVDRAFGVARTLAAAMGIPLRERLGPRGMNGWLQLLADALRRTPYGAPLEFEHPFVISLSATGFCPFACSNCYSGSGSGKASSPVRDRMLIFEKVAASKTPTVIVSGGEPLVAENIGECLELLLEKGKLVFVSTNALVDGHVDLVRKYDGLLHFILPVWGDQKRHDALRGAHSLARVEKNLAVLNAAGQAPEILMVLTKIDSSMLEEVLRLVRVYNVDVVTMTRRIDVGRIEGTGLDVSAEGIRTIRHWRDVLRKHVRVVVCDLPEMREKSPDRWLNWLVGLPKRGGCSAGSWMMHIDDSGQGFPCFSLEGRDNWASGRELSIAEQWMSVRTMRDRSSANALCMGEQR